MRTYGRCKKPPSQGAWKFSSFDYIAGRATHLTGLLRYQDAAQEIGALADVASTIGREAESLDDSLRRIDELDAIVGELEEAVSEVDAYARRLEARAKAP